MENQKMPKEYYDWIAQIRKQFKFLKSDKLRFNQETGTLSISLTTKGDNWGVSRTFLGKCGFTGWAPDGTFKSFRRESDGNYCTAPREDSTYFFDQKLKFDPPEVFMANRISLSGMNRFGSLSGATFSIAGERILVLYVMHPTEEESVIRYGKVMETRVIQHHESVQIRTRFSEEPAIYPCVYPIFGPTDNSEAVTYYVNDHCSGKLRKMSRIDEYATDPSITYEEVERVMKIPAVI